MYYPSFNIVRWLILTNVLYCYAVGVKNNFISDPEIHLPIQVQFDRRVILKPHDVKDKNIVRHLFHIEGRNNKNREVLNNKYDDYAFKEFRPTHLDYILLNIKNTHRPKRDIHNMPNTTNEINSNDVKNKRTNSSIPPKVLNVTVPNVGNISNLTIISENLPPNNPLKLTGDQDKTEISGREGLSNIYSDMYDSHNNEPGVKLVVGNNGAKERDDPKQTLITDNHDFENDISFNSSGDVSLNESDSWNQLADQFKRLYPIHLWKEHGYFDDNYLKLINIHWLGFPPPSKTAHYLIGGLYLCFMMCGAFGNILVIFMFFKCRSLRTPANTLVVNLAVSDFVMICKTPVFIYNSIYLGPALGQLGCRIYGFVGGLTGTVSIGTLAAIAFDRYTVVVYPLEPLRSITGLRAKLSVVLVWLYGSFFASIPVFDFGLGRYVPEGFLTSCSFDYLSDDPKHKIFIFAYFFAAWVLPFVIISFCYFKILQVVIATRSIGRKQAGSMSSRHCKEAEKNKTEMKLAGVVIGVIGLFFAAWTPYAVVALLGVSGQKQMITPIVSMVPAMFCKIASCIDPFVYVVTHPKFRQECENILLCKKERRRRSTVRQGWSTATTTKAVRQDQEITSEDDVEVVEMDKVPYLQTPESQTPVETVHSTTRRGLGRSSVTPAENRIETISSQTHISATPVITQLPTSLEDNVNLQPPSWFKKPQFDNTRGSSIKKVVKSFQRMKSDDSLQA